MRSFLHAIAFTALVAGCSMTASAQWSTNPATNNAICAAGGQFYPTIVSDGAGGAIITWEDRRTGFSDIYAQRINASGVVQWTADGVAICNSFNGQDTPKIVSDGAGGAIITWNDRRNGDSNNDVYAQRINGSGVVQWTPNGVAISNATFDQVAPTIVGDGAGGAIITWEDTRSGVINIYTQRINASGVV
ncbi:MAG TPA: hypothetical protein DGH68_06690, partial [Bacteroidetes bacterium]|nr:hypothetical protein [Bacteroidota bacterium]